MNLSRFLPAALAAGGLVLGLSACSNGQFPSAEPQSSLAPIPTGAPVAATGTRTTGAPTDKTVRLTTNDGLNLTFDVVSCSSTAADAATLTARSTGGGQLQVRVTAGRGTATYTGSDGERAGAVDTLAVAGSGALTASGTLDATAPGAAAATLRLSGEC